LSLLEIMGCNSGRSDGYVKYLYGSDGSMKIEERRKDSTGSNLKFDNALLRANAYSPGSRELCCKSADVVRITLYRAAGVSMCGLVYFSQ